MPTLSKATGLKNDAVSTRLFASLGVTPIVKSEALARARKDLLSRLAPSAPKEQLGYHPVCSAPFCAVVATDAWRHFETGLGDGDDFNLFYGPMGQAILHQAGTEFMSCVLDIPAPDDKSQVALEAAMSAGSEQSIIAATKLLDVRRVEHLGATILRLIEIGLAQDVQFLRSDRGFGKLQGHFLVGDVLFTLSKLPFWQLLATCREHGATTVCVVQELDQGPNPEPNRHLVKMISRKVGDDEVSFDVGQPGAARLSFFSVRTAVDPDGALKDLVEALTAAQRAKIQDVVDHMGQIAQKVTRGDGS
ncbi:hypothetical protein ACOI1H_21585 [Loktanella sp. DJP18]|uniref:hypothetical protein n=1 Tax=Loktanella sp. DJP18 TaxID=3409788 RepID=UPI003BB77DF3